MRAQVIGCLIEGCSIRSTVRMTGVAKKTVMRVLVEVGEVCSDGKRDALFPGKVHRLHHQGRERQSRPEAHFYFVCRAPELDGSHESASLHAPEQWLLAQVRESCGSRRTQLFRVQFHQDSPYTAHQSCDGCRRHRSVLGCE